jgi:nicotinamide mononucleotide (NMN) deamidase PncC
VVGAGRALARRVTLPGARGEVRRRAVVVALHLLRKVLER